MHKADKAGAGRCWQWKTAVPSCACYFLIASLHPLHVYLAHTSMFRVQCRGWNTLGLGSGSGQMCIEHESPGTCKHVASVQMLSRLTRFPSSLHGRPVCCIDYQWQCHLHAKHTRSAPDCCRIAVLGQVLQLLRPGLSVPDSFPLSCRAEAASDCVADLFSRANPTDVWMEFRLIYSNEVSMPPISRLRMPCRRPPDREDYACRLLADCLRRCKAAGLRAHCKQSVTCNSVLSP